MEIIISKKKKKKKKRYVRARDRNRDRAGSSGRPILGCFGVLGSIPPAALFFFFFLGALLICCVLKMLMNVHKAQTTVIKMQVALIPLEASLVLATRATLAMVSLALVRSVYFSGGGGG